MEHLSVKQLLIQTIFLPNKSISLYIKKLSDLGTQEFVLFYKFKQLFCLSSLIYCLGKLQIDSVTKFGEQVSF